MKEDTSKCRQICRVLKQQRGLFSKVTGLKCTQRPLPKNATFWQLSVYYSELNPHGRLMCYTTILSLLSTLLQILKYWTPNLRSRTLMETCAGNTVASMLGRQIYVKLNGKCTARMKVLLSISRIQSLNPGRNVQK